MSAPVFRTLDGVEYGRAEQVSPLIRRVIADNPSKFTYRGTGTYILGHGDVVVIDPGPRLESHRDALRAALEGERVRAILVTHCHSDHSPLAAWLHEETGAPTFAFGSHPVPDPKWAELAVFGPEWERDDEDDTQGHADDERDPVEMEESIDHVFAPTIAAADGDVVVDWGGLTVTAVHTPGHTSNHTCWALAQERALFTGDHVMGWSTTVVSPPDGDMAAYMTSLRKVAARADASLWPTHGPPRDDAVEYVTALADHRREREQGVLTALAGGRSTIREIVTALYANVHPGLHKAAAMSVWSHLLKLVGEGQVEVEGRGPAALASSYRRLD